MPPPPPPPPCAALPPTGRLNPDRRSFGLYNSRMKFLAILTVAISLFCFAAAVTITDYSHGNCRTVGPPLSKNGEQNPLVIPVNSCHSPGFATSSLKFISSVAASRQIKRQHLKQLWTVCRRFVLLSGKEFSRRQTSSKGVRLCQGAFSPDACCKPRAARRSVRPRRHALEWIWRPGSRSGNGFYSVQNGGYTRK